MKKLISLILVICMAMTAAAFAEEAEEEFKCYTDDHPEAIPYVSTWVAEDGDWRIEVYDEDGGIKLMVVHQLGDNKEDIWEYAAALGVNSSDLLCVPTGLHYKQDTVTGNWDVTYYEDGDGSFSLNENGKLLWNDVKEEAGKGLEFEKIGNFFGGRWMKDDIEVQFYAWYEGQYDIRLYQWGEGDEILKEGILMGVYNAETDTIEAMGSWGEDGITVIFSYDEYNNVVWTEDGVSTTMEYSYRTI